jgi:tetratricopeptide (TPR) repeat protein
VHALRPIRKLIHHVRASTQVHSDFLGLPPPPFIGRSPLTDVGEPTAFSASKLPASPIEFDYATDATCSRTITRTHKPGSFTTDDLEGRFAAAEATSTKALSLAPNHAWAHLVLGIVRLYTRRVIEGIAECEHALALDRNLATAHALIGFARYLLGRGAETEAHINEALRLSPRDSYAHRWFVWVGLAKAQLNADAEAVVWLRRAIDLNRNYSIAHFDLAAVQAMLGELDHARATVQAGLTLDPTFTIRRLRAFNTARSDNPTYLAGRERLIEGMRLAGVPEG